MKEYIGTALSPSIEQSITLKLLNSSLCGCEFELRKVISLFLVASPEELTNSFKFNDEAFIIPMDNESFNFEVIINPISPLSVELCELTESSRLIRSVNFNELITIGSLKIAIKASENKWEMDFDLQNEPKKTSFPDLRSKKKHLLILPVVLAMGLLFYFKGGLAAVISKNISYSDTHTVDRKKLVAIAPRPLLYSENRNNPVPINPFLSADQTESKLRAMPIEYVRKDFNETTRFTISGVIGDEELQQIKLLGRMVNNNKILLSINLKDDLTTGRSYLYGNGSYIKLSPNHWLVENL